MSLLRKLLFFTALSIAINSRADEPKHDFVMQIYNLSGLSAQIEYLPETIEMGVVTVLEDLRKKNKINATTVQQYVDVVRQSFVVEDLSDAILIYLDRQFSTYNTKMVLHWLKSDLGKRFTYLEKRSSQTTQVLKMRQFVQNLSESPPSDERLKLITELNQVTMAAKSTLILLMTQKLAIELTKSQFDAKSNKTALLSIMKRVARQQFLIEEEISSMVINGLLFTYQTATDAELQIYINFAKSNAGKRYHEALLGAYNSALLDASAGFGRILYKPKP